MRIPFTRHLGTAFMALVLGVILWGFSYMQGLQEIQIRATPEVALPEGWGLAQPLKDIFIRVRGPRRVIEEVNLEPVYYVEKPTEAIAALIDPSLDRQTVRVLVQASDLGKIGRDTRLLFLDLPKPVQVQIQRQERKPLPVRLNVTGTPAPGYVFSQEASRAVPSTVEVVGPKSILDSTDVICTELIDINNASTRFQAPIPIDAVMGGQPVETIPKTVTVIVDFKSKTGSRTFEKVPVQLVIPDDYPYRAHIVGGPAVAKVTVEGPEQALATLKDSDVSVQAPVSPDYKPSETVPSQSTLIAVVPPGFTSKVDPSTVALTVAAR